MQQLFSHTNILTNKWCYVQIFLHTNIHTTNILTYKYSYKKILLRTNIFTYKYFYICPDLIPPSWSTSVRRSPQWIFWFTSVLLCSSVSASAWALLVDIILKANLQLGGFWIGRKKIIYLWRTCKMCTQVEKYFERKNACWENVTIMSFVVSGNSALTRAMSVCVYVCPNLSFVALNHHYKIKIHTWLK